MAENKVVATEGKASSYMERFARAKERAAAGDVESGVGFEGVGGADGGGGGGYQFITEAVSEAGVYPVVGGYLDANGRMHSVVQMKALTGVEEDLLSNDEQPFSMLINAVLANCTVAIGSVIDPGEIRRAITHELSAATRTDMLIALRCVSYWEMTGAVYDFTVKCPIRSCQHENKLSLDLIDDLKRYEPPEPARDEYTVRLKGADVDVVWRRMRPDMSAVVEVVGTKGTPEERQAILTFAILMRLQSIGGSRVLLDPGDFVTSNHKRVKLSKVAKQCFNTVQRWSAADRGALRASFIENEPGIEMEFDFTCEACGRESRRVLDIMQRSFFFPAEDRAILKQTSST